MTPPKQKKKAHAHKKMPCPKPATENNILEPNTSYYINYNTSHIYRVGAETTPGVHSFLDATHTVLYHHVF